MYSDPVPAISEAAATGATATIYADLRATLGVNVVNLIWRHLAVFPDALPWAWATLKPVYVSGLAGVEAQKLKAGLTMPELPGWPPSLLGCADIDAAGQLMIRRILASYDRSNALNLAALSALLRRIDGVPIEIQADVAATEGPGAAVVGGELPRLLALDDVSADTADLIRRINRLGDLAQGRIVASMYRHLAHWPGFLALGYVQLAPLAVDGRLDKLIQRAIALGEAAGARLQAEVTVLPPPETVAAIRGAVADFIQHAIGKMVPIAALFMASMPK